METSKTGISRRKFLTFSAAALGGLVLASHVGLTYVKDDSVKMKRGVNIFIGADTGYTEKFQQQLREVEIELAIMGIGAYLPKSYEAHHATPEQAIQMAEEIGAKKIIPMHWGTFKLSQELWRNPYSVLIRPWPANWIK